MILNKRIIFSSLLLTFAIAVHSSITLHNILIPPIGNLIINAQYGNFTTNSHLSKHGIDLELKKYKWSYNIQKKHDRVIVHFIGPIITTDLTQKADMHIIEKELPDDILEKIYKINIGKCEKILITKDTKKGFLSNVSFCTNAKTTFVHYDIPDKKIMITYYPYIDSKEGRENFKEFIDAIKLDEV